MKRLITEDDVRRLERGARVVVDRDTLITPAARDHALLMGIEVAEASRVGAGRASAAACCDSCAVGGTCSASCGAAGGVAIAPLAEGDWLVQVRGGRASVRRIGP